MKESTSRVLRASLLAQRRAKHRIIEGYAQRIERSQDNIRMWRTKIAEAEDSIRLMKKDINGQMNEVADIIEAYHDLWADDDEIMKGEE